MITQAEFESRVSHWLDLVFSAQDAYALRMALAGREVTRAGDDQLAQDMAVADQYEQEYLPEEVLAHFLDPVSPPGIFEKISRSQALLEIGAAQRQADDYIRLAKKSAF